MAIYRLAHHLLYHFFEEGVALFDELRNETHLIPAPFDKPFKILLDGPLDYSSIQKEFEKTAEGTAGVSIESLDAFLTQARDSQLIVQVDP